MRQKGICWACIGQRAVAARASRARETGDLMLRHGFGWRSGRAERPALRIPFHLRGFAGQVEVFYGVNRDPLRAGFDALHIPLDLTLTMGFPVCRATITYEGTGYRAAMG